MSTTIWSISTETGDVRSGTATTQAAAEADLLEAVLALYDLYVDGGRTGPEVIITVQIGDREPALLHTGPAATAQGGRQTLEDTVTWWLRRDQAELTDTEENQDAPPAVVQYADDAYEAIRAINHRMFGAVPAPLAYAMLGNLKGVGHNLPQVLDTIGAGLAKSLTEYDVYDRNRDPAESVELARGFLTRAATKAAEVGELLEQAQSAINLQGYTVEHSQ